MATADRLLELMFSWISQRERCATQLKKMAKELVSLREKCNAGECIGNSMSVIGAACLLGAGAATLLTGGAAAPFLGLLGGVYTGVGITVSVVTKLTEHFLSSDTMKEAKKIEEESNGIAQRIQKLFDQLKVEIKKVSPSADLDEVDRGVMTELLGAMARRSELEMKIDFSKFHDMLHHSSGMNMSSNSLNTMPILLTGILTFFAFQHSGKGFKFLIPEGTKQLIKQMSTTGVKTAFKGGAMVVGGAVGLAFALSEAVDNWKEAIKKNHVTEASQSLRDTADIILQMTRELRKQFDNLRKMLVDMAEQQERERIEMARRQQEERIEMIRRQQEQERIEMARRQQEQERIEMARRQQEQERIEMARRQQEQEQQNNQTGSEPQGGDDQGDKESDQEVEESDQEDEESDQEDEESDQEVEESDQGDKECDQEDEKSDQGDKESDQEDEEHQQADNLPNITTFEYVVTVVQHDTWNEPILFINVYRPPTYISRARFRAFMQEFQSLLDHYRNYNNVIVAGDFNIWVDSPSYIPSQFLEFLENNNLVQHVTEPTHERNNILDLVISRNVDISDLSVQNDGISDHYTVSFQAKPTNQEGKAVKVGLLNCRSVNNKPEKICDLIERNNLDIFLLTETWSKDNTAFKAFRKASPEGFTFRYKSRPVRTGGGVAIVIRKKLLKQTKKMKSKKQDQDESAKRFRKKEE